MTVDEVSGVGLAPVIGENLILYMKHSSDTDIQDSLIIGKFAAIINIRDTNVLNLWGFVEALGQVIYPKRCCALHMVIL